MNVRRSMRRASSASSSRSGWPRTPPTSTSSRSSRCSRCSRAAGRSSCAKGSSSWPTASSARSTASRTGSTRKSCSTTRRRRRARDAHARAGLAMERVFAGREHEAAADLACHFHGAGDHLRAARYLRVAAGNALKRYAPREAAALLHGAVTHAAHLAPDERARVEIPLMLELGQAQLGGRRNRPRDTHADQARAARRRRAPSRRSPPSAADPRRSARRDLSRGGARLRPSDQGRLAASRPMPRWPRRRRFAPASSSCTSTGGRTRSPTAASRRGAIFRDRSPTSIARSPSACSSCTRRGRRTRTPGAPDGSCCRSRSRAATSPIAPTATTCWASPRCTSGAGTTRRRVAAEGAAVSERTGSTRYAVTHAAASGVDRARSVSASTRRIG